MKLIMDRSRYQSSDEAKITLELDLVEAGDLARLIRGTSSSGIPPLPSWMQDFARLANT